MCGCVWWGRICAATEVFFRVYLWLLWPLVYKYCRYISTNVDTNISYGETG